MTIPFPGNSVRGSKTGKPIMALLDLLGRTWALGIIWQLNKQTMTFRQLQKACEGISPTLLNTRIKELTCLSLLTKVQNGYQLTDQGKELFSLVLPLGPWSLEWQKAVLADKKLQDIKHV
ncbi:helix-turn-helix domain-containing protein [Thalassotalea sp. 1_MG-2023]|uniref:winged helix-turn-helix transcriptional regulator n=1 Tax=Thalassotalea sp. 1_MG-2023 TaxID=3062680 RepID=UPI0026E2C84D|nr:helix-turn-helix domain-containing protein [Thalassotalea sp. 1_MG-2023]MDO6428804.1 helix-turn-helix domain-containing protein [Thalassotalea sp. 1_MG-2023]